MELKSVLGRKDVFALAFGAIIGWGWVVLSGPMIEQGGSLGSMLAFLVGGLMVSFVGLIYAELTSALPRAGGALAFTYKALGPRWAWLCGWSLVLAYAGVCAFEAVAIATVFNYLFPNLRLGYLYSVAGSEVFASWIVIGIAGAILVGLINWLGIKTSALLQWIATLGLLLVGLLFFLGSNLWGSTANLQPYVTDSSGVLRVIILTPFLMMGFDIIPQAAEEIRIPTQEVGKIILFSISLAMTWYLLVQWGVGRSLPQAAQRASELATADAASEVFGFPAAGRILVLGGILGILTSWNAFFVGATRLLFGMGRARMLPSSLAQLHPHYQSPTYGILFVTAASVLAPFLGRDALVWVADVASLGIMVTYFLVSLSFLFLRRREPDMPRPFRLRRGMFIGVAALIITFGFILLYLPVSPSALIWPYEWGIVLAWVVLGFLAYWGSRRAHPDLNRADQARVVLGEYGSKVSAPITPGG